MQTSESNTRTALANARPRQSLCVVDAIKAPHVITEDLSDRPGRLLISSDKATVTQQTELVTAGMLYAVKAVIAVTLGHSKLPCSTRSAQDASSDHTLPGEYNENWMHVLVSCKPLVNPRYLLS